MQPDAVITLFRNCGALLDGHFQLSSGLHSGGYLQSALVLQYPDHAESLGAELASRFKDFQVKTVLSPALGGIIIGHEVARALGVRAFFVERQSGVLSLRRGFRFTKGERVLIAEDVITTGGSTRDTLNLALDAGAEVVGIAAIVDRSGGNLKFDVPFRVLSKVSLPTYSSETCPFCEKGLPIIKPGSKPTQKQ